VSKQRLLGEYHSQRLLLLGIIATVRIQEPTRIEQLLDLIRSEMPLPQLSSHVENMLAASPELSEACRRLLLGSDDAQVAPLLRTIAEDSTKLVHEPERVSGLPMNAQIILDMG
jgi:hypothetical protein